MDRSRSVLILILTILAGLALTVFIYLRYRVMFLVFFIPIIGIGGSLFSRMMRRRPMYGGEGGRRYTGLNWDPDQNRRRNHEHNPPYTVEPYDHGDEEQRRDGSR
jgi:hypothetical protein